MFWPGLARLLATRLLTGGWHTSAHQAATRPRPRPAAAWTLWTLTLATLATSRLGQVAERAEDPAQSRLLLISAATWLCLLSLSPCKYEC